MKIIIDKNKCIGCFKCKRVCYTVFEVDSDGKAKVRYGISEADIEDAKRAAITCPTGAITIVK
jgi:ferredoxin